MLKSAKTLYKSESALAKVNRCAVFHKKAQHIPQCMWENYDSQLFALMANYETVALTFRTLPGVPQVLHADELVVTVETVVLGFGVMVVEVLS